MPVSSHAAPARNGCHWAERSRIGPTVFMADHTSCIRDKLSQNYAVDGGILFSLHNLLAVIQSNIGRPKVSIARQPA